jgi:hypothetical protein
MRDNYFEENRRALVRHQADTPTRAYIDQASGMAGGRRASQERLRYLESGVPGMALAWRGFGRPRRPPRGAPTAGLPGARVFLTAFPSRAVNPRNFRCPPAALEIRRMHRLRGYDRRAAWRGLRRSRYPIPAWLHLLACRCRLAERSARRDDREIGGQER